VKENVHIFENEYAEGGLPQGSDITFALVKEYQCNFLIFLYVC
jgi:hypothetical protein